ncbi:MAG TPA: hypothetical protein VKX49_24160 [Bryobacteraceae bacterium]|nr:hypothetical protein [Bryobacteraceae bacterium]
MPEPNSKAKAQTREQDQDKAEAASKPKAAGDDEKAEPRQEGRGELESTKSADGQRTCEITN